MSEIGNEIALRVQEGLGEGKLSPSLPRKLMHHWRGGNAEVFRIAKDVNCEPKGLKCLMPEFSPIRSVLYLTDGYGSENINRAVETAVCEIASEESRRMTDLLMAAAKVHDESVSTSEFYPNYKPPVSDGKWSIRTFESVRYAVERHRLLVDTFVIPREGLSSLCMSGYVDPITERSMMLAGWVGKVLNAKILLGNGLYNEHFPKETLFALAAPEYLGSWAQRSLKVNIERAPEDLLSGWVVTVEEEFAMGIPNPKTVAMTTIKSDLDLFGMRLAMNENEQ